jgi:hypothetical protein
MPGYLAFDRDALGVLRISLELALYELNATVGRDPAAATARSRSQQAARSGEAWVPTLRGLTSCMTLEAYSPVGIDSSDLARAYFQQFAGGRSVVTDPVSAGLGLDHIAKAEALARVLTDGDIDDYLSDAEQRWLATQLDEISRSKAASQAFLSILGPDRFAELANTFSSRAERQFNSEQHSIVDPKVVLTLATLDSLGKVFGNFKADSTGPERVEWNNQLAELDPLALLCLVRGGVDVPGAWSNSEIESIAVAEMMALQPSFPPDLLDQAIGSQAIWLLSERSAVTRHFLESGESAAVERALLSFDNDARNALLLAAEYSGPLAFDPDQAEPSMQRVAAILIDWAYRPNSLSTEGSLENGLPTGIEEYFADFLPELLGRPELRSLDGESIPEWTLGLDDPNLLGPLLRLLCADEGGMKVFEQRADDWFARALGSGDASLMGSGAMLVASIADVRGFIYVDAVDGARSRIGEWFSLASFVNVASNPLGALDTSGASDAMLDDLGLNVRDAIAQAEAGGFHLVGLLQWSALTAWALKNGITGVPPFKPSDDSNSQSGSTGNGNLETYNNQLEKWIKTLDADDRAAAERVRTTVKGDAASGMGTVV